MKKMKTVVVFILSLVMSASYFVFSSGDEYGMSKNCERLASVVNDSEKLEYLVELSRNINQDSRIIELVGPLNYLDLQMHPNLENELGIDWQYLDMRADIAGIYLNGLDDKEGLNESFKVKSVSLLQGRNKLVIQSEGAEDLGLGWPSTEVERLFHLKDNFYFFCGL